MKKMSLVVCLLLLIPPLFAAKTVDAIMCLESFSKFGKWQPYVQYVRTSESRPDVAVELKKGQSIQFLKSSISFGRGQMVLKASSARLTPLNLTLRYTNQKDPTRNGNVMATGTLEIDGKKVDLPFECGISLH
jgi:hypothetical protein